MAIAILLAVLALGVHAPGVRAASPTLTILSPADGAVIGNGTPLTVIFIVSEFNLSGPGIGGGGSNEGHVQVFVDDALRLLTAESTVDLALPSGVHTIELRLVHDNGTGLTPDVRESVEVTVTQGPAVGAPRIDVTYVDSTFPIPGIVLDEDVIISFRVRDFALVPAGRSPPVPNEGHVAVLLDGVFNRAVSTYAPVAFADIADGDHTVTLRLVDNAGQPLTPDASDSVTFRTERLAVIDINPYFSAIQIVVALAILGVLFYRGEGLAFLNRVYERVRRRTP